MCGGARILRIIATVFLVIAFVALLLGYVAPFWTRKVDHAGLTAGTTESVLPPTTTTTTTTMATTSEVHPESNFTMVDAYYEGLWLRCDANLTCNCFAQSNFHMERTFPAWILSVQGLFGIGLIILFVALVVVSCNICCCRCCRESFAVATVAGSLVVVGLIVIAAALAVYGGFACWERRVGLTGPDVKFDWGYYLSIAGAGVLIIPAILLICDGRRNEVTEHGDDCETAKMV